MIRLFYKIRIFLTNFVQWDHSNFEAKCGELSMVSARSTWCLTLSTKSQ